MSDDAASPDDRRRRAEYRRKSSLAFGLAAICVLFILETLQAHRVQPHPASPFIWTALGLAAAGGVGLGLWWRRRAGGG